MLPNGSSAAPFFYPLDLEQDFILQSSFNYHTYPKLIRTDRADKATRPKLTTMSVSVMGSIQDTEPCCSKKKKDTEPNSNDYKARISLKIGLFFQEAAADHPRTWPQSICRQLSTILLFTTKLGSAVRWHQDIAIGTSFKRKGTQR